MGVLTTLGINGQKLFAQLLNFSIVLLVLWKWVYQPLLKVMDARTKKINEGLANAVQAKEQVAKAQVEQERLLKVAHQEAQKILKMHEEEAKKERQTLLEQTRQEVERMTSEAQGRLKQEEVTMLQNVKRQVADLVVLTTEKVLPTLLDHEAKQKLMKEAVAQVNGSKKD